MVDFQRAKLDFSVPPGILCDNTLFFIQRAFENMRAPPTVDLTLSLSLLCNHRRYVVTMDVEMRDASACATPTIADGGPTAYDLYKSLDLSPLEHGGRWPLSDIEARANQLLLPLKRTWNSFNRTGQSKLVFLIVKGQDSIHSERYGQHANAKYNFAKLLGEATDETTAVGLRLKGLLQKGGDRPLGQPVDVLPGNLPHFLLRNSTWNDGDSAPTIFNNPDERRRVDPFYRLQGDNSPVCYLLAASNLIYYSLCMHGALIPNQATQTIALNVNRFIRRRFSSDLIYDYVFEGVGGFPAKMLLKLLQPYNPDSAILHYIDINFELAPDAMFIIFKHAIRTYGALLIEDFQVFDELVDDNSLIHFQGSTMIGKHIVGTHTVLVVGVRETSGENDMGGLEFLLQNSWLQKPFITVGYDLLKALGIARLVTLEPGLSFDVEADKLEFTIHTVLSGHAREFDDSVQGRLADDSVSQDVEVSERHGKEPAPDNIAGEAYHDGWISVSRKRDKVGRRAHL